MNHLSHDKTEALRWLDLATQRDHREKIASAGDRISAEVRVEVEVLMHLRGGFDETRPGLLSRLENLGFDETPVLAALDRMLLDGGVGDGVLLARAGAPGAPPEPAADLVRRPARRGGGQRAGAVAGRAGKLLTTERVLRKMRPW